MKRCSRCNQILSLTSFNKDKDSSDKRQRWCRGCEKKYRDAHKEENRLYEKERYANAKPSTELVVCKCGCGELIPKFDKCGKQRKFVREHCNRNIKLSDEHKAKLSKAHKGKKLTLKHKNRIGIASKVRWGNFNSVFKTDEVRDKRIKSVLWNRKMTLPEKALDNILQDTYPNEFKFVGNGRFCIHGFCPDFVNINGRKQFIEMFGGGKDWFHTEEEAIKRITLFKSYGYSTLIIWEKDLVDIDILKEKLNSFINYGENYG